MRAVPRRSELTIRDKWFKIVSAPSSMPPVMLAVNCEYVNDKL